MWDLYNSSAIAVPTHKTIPTGAPLIAWSNQLEVALENGTSFHYGPHNAVPDWVIQDQRHAYYACVSYVDEHVGAILEALDESGTADNTAVIFHACVRHHKTRCPACHVNRTDISGRSLCAVCHVTTSDDCSNVV